jgi:hypothetical protein
VQNLNEGGNVFRDAQGNARTQRINLADIKPTVSWLETVTGLPLQANMLGSTGQKPTSGDLDLGVDSNQMSKDELARLLSDYVTQHGQDPRDWVKKSGISVHFLTPIRGRADSGFVQTDFMFVPKMEWAKFMLAGSPPDSDFKGASRNILINSVGKALGYKLNQNTGLMDRSTNELITDDPDKIAKMLLNPQATAKDLRSVETIMAALKNDAQRDAKLADFRDHMERAGTPIAETTDVYTEYNEVNIMARLRDRIVNQGMQPLVENQRLQESKSPRIPYIEDLVFQKGAAGAQEALAIVNDTAKNSEQHATIKWDGSPAVIFGRDDRGQFMLTDKGGAAAAGGSGLAKSPDEIASIMAQRDERAAAQGKAADRVEKLVPVYRELWPYLEAATPRDFRGYLKGDLLYSSSDPVRDEDGRLVFQPNKHDGIVYRIPRDSELGRRIRNSRIGLAIHTRMDDPAGAEQPVTDPGAMLKSVPGLMVAGATVPGLKNLEPNQQLVQQIKALSSGTSAQAMNSLFNPTALRDQRITDLPALMERFINSLKGTDYSRATPADFGKWLEANVTPQKYRNIAEYLTGANLQGMQAAFDTWNLVHRLKIDLQRQLDQQQPGQEGWVLATPAGRAKLVSRMAGGFGARKSQSKNTSTAQN